jgi:hypothetical protein
VVGNPRDGFSMTNVEAAFRKDPETSIVIIRAHGNIHRKRHFMQIAESVTGNGKSGRIWASHFYRSIAKYSNSKPLNVFMFSCGSGNGCESAIGLLPSGSTLVNFVEKGKVSSHLVEAEALKIKADNGDNLAEQLFLGILCNGFKNCEYYPQLSVSAAGERTSQVWQMWDSARGDSWETYDMDRLDVMDPALEVKINSFLADHISSEKVSMAIRSIELYLRTQALEIPESPGTPIKPRIKIDADAFYNAALEHKILGPMFAVGYYMNRQQIGAFQTWDIERYRQPFRPKTEITGPFSALFQDQIVPT